MTLFRRSSKRQHATAESRRTSEQISALAELGFDYTLKRSTARRSVAVSIKDTEVTLSAPHTVCGRELHRWLVGRRDWVLNKLREQNLRAQEIPVRHYCTGDKVRYLGVDYPLEVVVAPRSVLKFSLEQGFTVALGPSPKNAADRVQGMLQQWFKRQARELLLDKTAYLCDQMQLEFTDMQLRRTKRKWGHCTSKGVIQYNWLILTAPEPVIDYLVAHEVCHLRHLNHSSAFWALVGKACPDFKQQKTWLQRNGHTLVV